MDVFHRLDFLFFSSSLFEIYPMLTPYPAFFSIIASPSQIYQILFSYLLIYLWIGDLPVFSDGPHQPRQRTVIPSPDKDPRTDSYLLPRQPTVFSAVFPLHHLRPCLSSYAWFSDLVPWPDSRCQTGPHSSIQVRGDICFASRTKIPHRHIPRKSQNLGIPNLRTVHLGLDSVDWVVSIDLELTEGCRDLGCF